MGGFGSGRQGGRPTVEACRSIKLDINELMRCTRRATTGQDVCSLGPFRWTSTRTGDQRPWAAGLVTFELTGERGHADLLFSVNHASRPTGRRRQRVRLEAMPCRFGGQRWWWVCASTGRRCAVLYLPNGGRLFLGRGRGGYDLAYQSQRGTPLDRSHVRLARLYQRLGAEYRGLDDAPPPRPKWMHQRTYARFVEEWDDVMDQHDELLFVSTERLLQRASAAPCAG